MGRAEDIFQRIIKRGEDEINEFILTRKSEELFLDFKRSADEGSGRKLHDNDRNNLARAISGFGNSEGGVIVWGIDCSRDEDYADIARAKVPIRNVNRFVSWLEGAVSGCTVPPHSGVQNKSIPTNDRDDGFAVTYIPKSNRAPHQVVGTYRYLIRAGSSFAPTPHAVLAGMFGRRPQPHVYPMFGQPPARIIDDQIQIEIVFQIRNDGPGIASDLFASMFVESMPGDNCKMQVDPVDLPAPVAPTNWMFTHSFGRSVSIISNPDIRMPPESFLEPLKISLVLASPFSNDLRIDGICGCGQSPPYRFGIQRDAESIRKVYTDFLEKSRKHLLTVQEEHKMVKAIWNVVEIEKR